MMYDQFTANRKLRSALNDNERLERKVKDLALENKKLKEEVRRLMIQAKNGIIPNSLNP